MHFVCVHGVCHGGWCWEDTRADLEALGHQVSTPDLPLTNLADDANAVIAVLDAVAGPAVLVGHSYGGLVISKAAKARKDVSHLVYVAAIMIGENENFPELAAAYPSNLGDHLIIADDNTFSVDPAGALECFYNCCERGTAQSAADRLRSTSFDCLASPSGAEPWTTTPSTYVLCSQDEAIAPQLQQLMAKRAGDVSVLDTDHSPFYSAREEFLSILCGI